MSSIDRTYNEKRDFIRMKINSEVTVKHSGGEFTAVCKDLSAAGMLIASSEALTVGEQVNLFIAQEGENRNPFDATADVSRCDATDEGNFIIGFSLKDIR